MSAVLKLFKSAEKKKKNANHYLDIGEIGMPTQVSHNFSGKINPDGTIDGIPESWKQRLKLMMSNEEAENPQNTEKAAQIFKWIEDKGRSGQSDEFMRVNSESPSNSVGSGHGSGSDASFVSYVEDFQENCNIVSEAVVNGTAAVPNDSAVDNSAVNNINTVTVCDNDLPTLRRKKKKTEPNTRQGPRVTRNLTEEQVVSQLQACCNLLSPWELYQKVPLQICLPFDVPKISKLNFNPGSGGGGRSRGSCKPSHQQTDWRKGCNQRHRLEQTNQERPNSNGNQSDEGATSP